MSGSDDNASAAKYFDEAAHAGLRQIRQATVEERTEKEGEEVTTTRVRPAVTLGAAGVIFGMLVWFGGVTWGARGIVGEIAVSMARMEEKIDRQGEKIADVQLGLAAVRSGQQSLELAQASLGGELAAVQANVERLGRRAEEDRRVIRSLENWKLYRLAFEAQVKALHSGHDFE